MASTPVDQRYILISTRGMDSGSVEVRVKDRGHGIRALENGRLFEPFYTTKEHGLGLGLAICSAIIAGTWWAAHSPERRKRGRDRDVFVTELGGYGVMTDEFTVYLVDDDAGVRKGLSRLLRARGMMFGPTHLRRNSSSSTTLRRLVAPYWTLRCRA